MTGDDTTVWDLAAETGRPLEVVIFQAVAYEACNEGGRIDGEWAAALKGVLQASEPWRRKTHRHQPPAEGAEALPGDGDAGAGSPSPPDPAAEVAARVLENLGQPVEVADPQLAAALAAAGLGEVVDGRLVGFAEEAPTWAQLADGSVTLSEVTSR